MSSKSCPDWPAHLEIAPDLHSRHFTAAEARLPAGAPVALGDVLVDAVTVCADLDRNVFNSEHTDPGVAAALASSHWLELDEWLEQSRRDPG